MHSLGKVLSFMLAFMLLAGFSASNANAAGKQVVVKMVEQGEENYVFSPKTLTIEAGDTVVWENDTDAPHTVSSDNGVFESGNMNEDQKFSFTFTKPGTYPYYCKYHGGPGGQGMAGTVVVKPKAGPTANETPVAQPTATPAANGSTASYTAKLDALNDSGTTGTAWLTLNGNKLSVSINATGLEADQVHAQHIHGLSSGNASCPPMSADKNGDGLVSLEEGVPFYGAVLQPLEPYPTADASGKVNFKATYTVDPSKLGSLTDRVIVLHGMTVKGKYDGSLPVACGQIESATSVPGTGGGGMADSHQVPVAPIAAGIGMLMALGGLFAIRARKF